MQDFDFSKWCAGGFVQDFVLTKWCAGGLVQDFDFPKCRQTRLAHHFAKLQSQLTGLWQGLNKKIPVDHNWALVAQGKEDVLIGLHAKYPFRRT